MAGGRTDWHWQLVLAATLGVGASAIPTYSIGLFQSAIATDLKLSSAQVVSGVMITSIASMLGAPIVGRLGDRFGARPLAIAGACIAAMAVAMIGRTSGYTEYALVWVLVGLGVALASPVVWTMPVAKRLAERRALALSIVLSGTNMLGASAPLVSAYLIDRVGWRDAWIGLGGYMALLALPFALLFFRDPPRGDASEAGKGDGASTPQISGLSLQAAAGTREFRLLAIFLLLAGTAVTGLLIHFVPMLTGGGIATYEAAGVFSLLSITALVGRISSGWAMDRVFAPRLAALILLGCAAAQTAMASGAFAWPLPILYALLCGIALGAVVNLTPLLTARYFGLRSYGAIHGILFAIFCAGFAAGPVLIGFLFDRAGNYGVALTLLAALNLAGAVLMFGFRPYPSFEAQPGP